MGFSATASAARRLAKKRWWRASPFVVPAMLAVGFALVLLRDLARVPYHPDESSQLYMSRDFDTLVLQRNPAALAWLPGEPVSPDARLRLLDAPLTRYLLGAGWWLAGYTSEDLNADWTWGAAWEENAAAIPRLDLLLAARRPLAVLGALAAVAAFAFGKRLGGLGVGVVAAFLLALDPLTLLHSRRAMAESALTVFSVLAVLGILYLTAFVDSLSSFSWKVAAGAVGVGVLAGLALSSKQTELVMIPVALLAVGWALGQRPWPVRTRLAALGTASAGIALAGGLTFLALNPVLYAHPLEAAREMMSLRAELATEQVRVNGESRPEEVLSSVPARLGAAVAQLYWQPPAVWDAPVYLDHLQPAAAAYFADPLMTLLRQPPLSLALLGLTAWGLGASARRIYRDRGGPATRPEQVLWLWAGVTLALLALVIPLNWQRYFLPLLPPSRLFAALGAAELARRLALVRLPHAATR